MPVPAAVILAVCGETALPVQFIKVGLDRRASRRDSGAQ